MAGNKYNLVFQECIFKDYKKGVKRKEIATKYFINKSIVCRIIMLFNEVNPLETEHKGGRPHKTCRFTDRKIIRHFKKNRFDRANHTIQETFCVQKYSLQMVKTFRTSELQSSEKPFIFSKN